MVRGVSKVLTNMLWCDIIYNRNILVKLKKGNMENKKIRLTNESALRQILSFEFDDRSYDLGDSKDIKERQMVVMTTYALNKLAEKYRVENRAVNVVFDYANIFRNVGAFYSKDNKMEVSFTTLLDSEEYADDLLTFFHECYHFAHHAEKISDGTKYATNKSIARNGTLNEFFQRLNAKKGIYADIDIQTQDEAKLDKMVGDYIFARYILDPRETEARQFSYDMLESVIIDGAALEGLTPKEKHRLIDLNEKLSHAKNQELETRKACDRYMKKEDYLLDMVHQARAAVLEQGEDGKCALDEYVEYSEKNHAILDIVNGDIVEDMMYTLFLDYDEALANKLFDVMVNVKDRNRQYKCLKNVKVLCERTNFSPTNEQVDLVNSLIEKQNARFQTIKEKENRIPLLEKSETEYIME